jgi:hypothetical protein
VPKHGRFSRRQTANDTGQFPQLARAALRGGLGTGDRDDTDRRVDGASRSRSVQDRAAGHHGAIAEAVDGQPADEQKIDGLAGIRGGRRRIIGHRSIIRHDMSLFFYELHEGATDLMTDALLISEREIGRDEFANMVQTARRAVLDTFEEDTLVEAVAREMERRFGFIYAADEKLRASMSVGVEDEDTFLVDQSDDYRSIVVELDKG